MADHIRALTPLLEDVADLLCIDLRLGPLERAGPAASLLLLLELLQHLVGDGVQVVALEERQVLNRPEDRKAKALS